VADEGGLKARELRGSGGRRGWAGSPVSGDARESSGERGLIGNERVRA
jgi:hypothetical protein